MKALVDGEAQSHAHPRLGACIQALADILRRARSASWGHINSHIGHPWNELADGLADQASKRDLMTVKVHLVEWLADHKLLQWEWLRQASPAKLAQYPPIVDGHFIVAPTSPEAQASAVARVVTEIKVKAELKLELATLNSRSLNAKVVLRAGVAKGKGKGKGKTKAATIGKRFHLAMQFADLGSHIVALQETSTVGEIKNAGDYACYSSGSQAANRGCELWLNTQKAITVQGVPHFLSARTTFVLHQSNRLLVLKTKVAAEYVVIASAYAPHEEAPSADK